MARRLLPTLVLAWWFIITGEHPVEIGPFSNKALCTTARKLVLDRWQGATECYARPYPELSQ